MSVNPVVQNLIARLSPQIWLDPPLNSVAYKVDTKPLNWNRAPQFVGFNSMTLSETIPHHHPSSTTNTPYQKTNKNKYDLIANILIKQGRTQPPDPSFLAQFVGSVLSQAVFNRLSATSFDVIVKRQRKVRTGNKKNDCTNVKALQRFTVVQGQRNSHKVNSSRSDDGLDEVLLPGSVAVAFYDVPKSEAPGCYTPAPTDYAVDGNFNRMVYEIECCNTPAPPDSTFQESGFFVLSPNKFDVTKLELTVTMAVGDLKVSERSARQLCQSYSILFGLY